MTNLQNPSTESELAAIAHAFDLPRLCQYFSECSPQPMVAVEGPAHIVRYANSAFMRLADMTVDQLLGRAFTDAAPESAENGCLALLDRVFGTGMPEYLQEQPHKQLSPAFWSYAMWAILGDDKQPIGVMIQVTNATEAAIFRRNAMAMNEALVVSSVRQHELIDTIKLGEQERRALQMQMFEAQKLESLGVLAGGIAHDLNNMLTPVVGFAELALGALPEGSRAAPLLEEVGKNARRAADLVQQILAYAGKGRFVVAPVELSSLIGDMDGLLRAAVSKGSEFVCGLAPGLPAVEADATQLRQVVMNLVTNASEAIGPGGGVITVRTGVAQVRRQTQWPSLFTANPLKEPSVFLEVSDTGCGMTADVIEKIFDPFYTTKFTGRGLGLAVVQGIARGHGGAIEVRSEPGKGSTFRLILPSTSKTTAAPVPPQQTKDWRGTGTILVIDDDKAVRDIAGYILKQAGLNLFFAEDGQDGLKVFCEHQQEITAILLDMTMPKLGGLDAARELRRLRPDLPIVLMSGFSLSEQRESSEGLGISGFVQKPFHKSQLLAAIDEASRPAPPSGPEAVLTSEPEA